MPVFIEEEKSVLEPRNDDYLEAARYLGYSKISVPEEDVFNLIKECCTELYDYISPKAVYEIFPLKNDGAHIEFADIKLDSKNLGVNLRDCSEVCILASTIGPKTDALIRKYGMTDTVRAGILQACGAMYIEKFVDYVNDKIKKEAELSGKTTKPRYSPGFGDVSLEVQKDFFRFLPCTRIGLTLMDTLIMSPEKSVTAFIGIKN